MVRILEPTLISVAETESREKSFGAVFAMVFALIGCLPLLHWQSPRWWALGVSAVLAIVALVRPKTLRLLNLAWLAFGRLLHRVVSMLIMSVIFFLCVTPTAWIMRLIGKDLLSLKRRSYLKSYWVARESSPPAAESMKNQF